MGDRWQLKKAKSRLSELVRKAREEGPQVITVRGNDAAVVLSAERYAELVGRKGTLVDFFRKSPLMREQAHLVLLDEASKGWEDVERGRTLSVAKVRAKYKVAKKH